MIIPRLVLFVAFSILVLAVYAQQDYRPPPSVKPDEANLKDIEDRTEKLRDRIESLRRRGVSDSIRAEAEIFLKAATWIGQQNEFWSKDSAAWTLDAIDRGLLRAGQIGQGEVPWVHEKGHAVARGYRSRVDGSLQPYAVTFPADYGKDVAKRWRVDVVLHGRDTSLNEVKFLYQHNGEKPSAKEDQFVRLDIFGRGNVGYRWAGETDVNEVIEHFLNSEKTLGRLSLIDTSRVVLRGFSMGGAGAWHLGLHQPGRWSVVGPGAGFTTTHGYWAELPEKLPAYQEACLRIYDAVDYAENAGNVPIVAYSGENDPQIQAARNVQTCLKPLGIPMTLLIAPGLKHEFPAEWQKKAEEQYAKHLSSGKNEYPQRVRFVTYTLKYNSCNWVSIHGLEKHYERALVEAELQENGYTIKTANVRALEIDLPSGSTRKKLDVVIDDQRLEVRPYLTPSSSLHVYLEKKAGKWMDILPERLATDQVRHLRKASNKQGPIDDAFTEAFLCVRGTGKAWNEAPQQFANESLERFAVEWSKYFRGELPIKNDEDVSPEDLTSKNLILFGDPSSNSLIAQVVDALPLQWTKEDIQVGATKVSAANHLPVMIYPSPLQSGRYVVLNSGHTFHKADFQGTNARLFPRLGDYALIKPTPKQEDPLAFEVVTAGLFDDSWRIK
jgi:predicted esterase